ncbi:LAME_0H17898g1_1 [Lachancea meyersii CBS 8951]|uniref:LAME_0H17898g1_1 n=1 Tax=Lachancea meyersii CBS 8951 TaxID=1266667 RepID=A0A1G4KII3_9SACH|nr:LAME_0H17898g1_1 [Lachancea meyersii CBS 8951]
MDKVTKWWDSCRADNLGKHAKCLIESATETLQNNDKMTGVYAATTALGALIFLLVLRPLNRRFTDKKENKKKNKRGGKKKSTGLSAKKAEKPVTLEEQIENVYKRYLAEYKQGLDALVADFDPKSEKQQYQLNYYNEMLLKLVIELDGVDLVDLEGDRKIALKDRRKCVIREIQTDLKRLDSLKKLSH